jgi:hypothetical protein
MKAAHEVLPDLCKNTFSATEIMTLNAGETEMLGKAATSY